MRASTEMAFAISTICCCAMLRFADNVLRRHRDAQLLEHLRRSGSHHATIDDAKSSSRKPAKKNIFFRRKARSERQFLVDHDDARRERFARRTKPARFAIDHQLTAVWLVDSA